MRLGRWTRLVWGSVAIVVGVLTFTSFTKVEHDVPTLLPPDVYTVPEDGFPINFVNLLPLADARKNVLFLMSDDLRPQLGYHHGKYAPNPDSDLKMITPNLDQLASKSLVLERAYAQLSMCGPSRTSLLTGRRPDTNKVWNQKSYWRKVAGNFTTIPQYFKQNGYITSNVGKIFHPRKASGKDDPVSWTEPIYQPPDKYFWRKQENSWKGFSKDELAEVPHPDQLIANEAVRRLRELAPRAKRGEKFFLGVGFLKPHLPFTFPEEYLELYPPEEVDMPPNPHVPQNYPTCAYTKPSELLNREDITQLKWSGDMNVTINGRTTRELRRAYYACVSFIDDMVGQVVRELHRLGLADDTVVSFIGDHGWHLGENGRWGKHTNMEQGTHTPMMIHIPGVTESGVRSDTVVELVDLFPTVAAAAGLPTVPSCPQESTDVELCTEGVDLLPLVENPRNSLKEAAFSQHKLYKTPGMGYSIKTDRFRYTVWIPVERNKRPDRTYDYTLEWEDPVGEEIYDHYVDLNENVNRIDDPEYVGYVQDLKARLRQQVGDVITNVREPFD